MYLQPSTARSLAELSVGLEEASLSTESSTADKTKHLHQSAASRAPSAERELEAPPAYHCASVAVKISARAITQLLEASAWLSASHSLQQLNLTTYEIDILIPILQVQRI